MPRLLRDAREVVRELKEEAEALTSVIHRLKRKGFLDFTVATCALATGVQSKEFTVAALVYALLHGARTWDEYRTQRFDIRSRLGGHLHGDDLPAQDDCKAHGPWPGRKHRH